MPTPIPSWFWDEVASACWRRAPRVWRRPFTPAHASEADVFRALTELTARLDRGDASVVPRVYIGDRPAGFSLDRHAARPDDHDMAGFERRLLAGLSGRELGMVVGDAASLDPELWWRATRFLRGLYAAVGTTAGGAHAEVFFGNYQRSFFGVHKDRLETFTFVVRGRKRFLAWPYEALAHLPGVPEQGELHAFGFEDLDLGPLRETATIIEGGPGDVFFWPAGWWHVAEAVPEAPGFVTTLTLAVAPSTMLAAGSPLRLAQEGFDEAGKEGYYTEDPPLPDLNDPRRTGEAIDTVTEALTRVLEDPVFVRARHDQILVWLSLAGFKRGPERGPIPALAPDDVLETRAVIYYDPRETRAEDGFSCAVNGVLLQTLPAFMPLVERLNAGGQFEVQELVAAYAGGEGQPEAGDLVEALAHLTSAGALRVIERIESHG